MSPRPQPRAAHTAAAPYRSSACRVGAHEECAHSSPTSTPAGVPVVYEACACACQRMEAPDLVRGFRTRGWAHYVSRASAGHEAGASGAAPLDPGRVSGQP